MIWKTVIEEVNALSPKPRKARIMAVDYLVVHHSVTPPTYDWEHLLDIHINKGYRSIGYHFVVRGSDGQVYKCLPVSPAVVGAHAKSQNSVSLGVCVTGNYELGPPNNDALAGLWSVLKELHKAYPKAKILGHREMTHSRTACPGRYLQAALEKWRSNLKGS